MRTDRRIPWTSLMMALIVSVPVLLASCGPDDSGAPAAAAGPFDLTFAGDATFSGPHADQTVKVTVKSAADGAVVAVGAATVSGSSAPAFSFSFPGVLREGVAYTVDYWIDSNLAAGTTGACDSPLIDHQWRVAIPAVSGDVTRTETDDPTTMLAVCGSFATFDLTFSGDASFQAPHGDHIVHVTVVRALDQAVVAGDFATVSANVDPAFTFSFPGILQEGVAYAVDYWMDSNFGGGSTGTCDPIANDHQWRVAIAAVIADVAQTEFHNLATTTDVCASFATFDFTFEGDASFQPPHGNHTVTVAVVRASDQVVVARQSGTVSALADPSFAFLFPGILRKGLAYHADYWIDSNFGGGSPGVCDPIANDHQWRVPIASDSGTEFLFPAAIGPVSLTESHDPTTIVDVCASFATVDLTFSGSGYTPHPDQSINIALVRTLDGEIAAREAGRVALDGTFSFTTANILQTGLTYTVDYYIDSNFGAGFTLGVCDPSTNDHQWRIVSPVVSGPITAAVTHNFFFTPVCGSFPSTARWRTIQDTVFTPICAGCHIGAFPPAGLRLDEANSPRMVGTASTEIPTLSRIEPGEPGASYLVWKIEGQGPVGEPIVGGRMPPFPTCCLGPPTIQLIKDWVTQGAQVP